MPERKYWEKSQELELPMEEGGESRPDIIINLDQFLIQQYGEITIYLPTLNPALQKLRLITFAENIANVFKQHGCDINDTDLPIEPTLDEVFTVIMQHKQLFIGYEFVVSDFAKRIKQDATEPHL